MKLGVDVLPKFNRDTTDRNRTSPLLSQEISLNSVCWDLPTVSHAPT